MIVRSLLAVFLATSLATPAWTQVPSQVPSQAPSKAPSQVPSQATQADLTSLCMMVEQLSLAGSCCTFTDQDLAEVMGVRAGRLLADLAAPSQAESRLLAQANPSSAPVVDEPVVDQPVVEQPALPLALPQPAVDGIAAQVAASKQKPKQLLLAKIHIESRDAEGEKKVICRPHVLTIEGEEAMVEIGQANGESLIIKVRMMRVPTAREMEKANSEADSNAALPEEESDSPTPEDQNASDVQTAKHLLTKQPQRVFASPEDSGWTPNPAPEAFEEASPIVIPDSLGFDWSIAQENEFTVPGVSDSPMPTRVISSRKSIQAMQPTQQPALPEALDDPYFARKMLYEGLYEKKIRRLLAHIPDVEVTVEVELSRSTQHREEHSQTIGNQTNTIIEQSSPLTPQAVRASIAFPDSYVVQIWESQRVNEERPTVEELDGLMDEIRSSIETLVNNVLPSVAPGQDPYPRIAVRSYTPVEMPPQSETLASYTDVRLAERESSPPADEAASWMLGVIAITLLCASIGAAVLFRQAPPSPPQAPQAQHNDSLLPPSRRAA